MSNLITQAFVEQYRDNVLLLSQQRGSKLRSMVFEEELVGRTHYFDRLAKTVAAKKTSRHADTPITNSQHSRRRVQPDDYQWADFIDRQDRLRMLLDPEDAYVVNAGYAIGRAIDTAIIEAFNADADTGQSGGTAVSFPAGQVIDNSGTPTKFTLAYLRQAKQLFDSNEVDSDGRVMVIAPKALEDLLEDSTVTSADFNSIRALVMGEMNTFLGFEFITSTLLPLGAGNIRSCFAWQQRAMGLAMNADLEVFIDRLPGKQQTTQVYVSSTFGSIRLEEESVIQIDFDEDL